MTYRARSRFHSAGPCPHPVERIIDLVCLLCGEDIVFVPAGWWWNPLAQRLERESGATARLADSL